MKKTGVKRKPLSRERITEAAMKFIDENGMDALSMRQLGKVLKVEAMALYHHFANKGELLDAVLERLVGEVELLPRGDVPPLERVRQYVRSHRELALHHPHAFILIPTRRFNIEKSIEIYEQVLQAFKDIGLDAALSAQYFRTLGYFVSGAGLADIAGRAMQPDATPVRLETFNDPRFPLVTAVVKHLQANKLDGIFEYGVEIILQAMVKDAEKLKSDPVKSKD